MTWKKIIAYLSIVAIEVVFFVVELVYKTAMLIASIYRILIGNVKLLTKVKTEKLVDEYEADLFLNAMRLQKSIRKDREELISKSVEITD